MDSQIAPSSQTKKEDHLMQLKDKASEKILSTSPVVFICQNII